MLFIVTGDVYRILNNMLNEPMIRVIVITYIFLITIEALRLSINFFYIMFPALHYKKHIPKLARKCLEEWERQ